jgi:hypothetical protein
MKSADLEDADKLVPAQERARLNVIECVYFQSPLHEPTCIETRHGRFLDTEEQPYSRRMLVGEEWTPVDTGWIGEECGLLVVRNHELRRVRIPTRDEQAEDATRVVEVNFEGLPDAYSWLVLNGESMRGLPRSTKGLKVRCRHGSTAITVTLFPR